MYFMSYCLCPVIILAGRYLQKSDFFFRKTRKSIIIWWHRVLQIRYAMAHITPNTSTPKDVKERFRALKGIDPDDPNDATIELVTMFVLLWLNSESRARTGLHCLLYKGV